MGRNLNDSVYSQEQKIKKAKKEHQNLLQKQKDIKLKIAEKQREIEELCLGKKELEKKMSISALEKQWLKNLKMTPEQVAKFLSLGEKLFESVDILDVDKVVESVQKSAVSEELSISENPKTTEIENVISADNFNKNYDNFYEKSIKDKEKEDKIYE